MQAILDVKYQFPKGLTRECRDLLRGIFQKDPSERLTVAEIKKHPWFKSHLPEELSVRTDLRCRTAWAAWLRCRL